MMDRRLCFIQFSHPGEEQEPCDKSMIGWNATYRKHKGKLKPVSHKRKFMQLHGEWIKKDKTKCLGDLWAWGEWEPESNVIFEFDATSDKLLYPRYLWRPYWIPKKTYRGLHNTDPFIFGDCMLYSNCGQFARKSLGLRQLARGSIIAFGSGKKDIDGRRRWMLDTVLVVKRSYAYDPQCPQLALRGRVPESFFNITGRPLADNPSQSEQRVIGKPRLYQGATPDESVEGMFSFFPAMPAGGLSGFRRPFIDLPKKYFNPYSWRGPKGLRCNLDIDERRELWNSLVRQVYDAGLVLGTRADVPPRRMTAGP